MLVNDVWSHMRVIFDSLVVQTYLLDIYNEYICSCLGILFHGAAKGIPDSKRTQSITQNLFTRLYAPSNNTTPFILCILQSDTHAKQINFSFSMVIRLPCHVDWW